MTVFNITFLNDSPYTTLYIKRLLLSYPLDTFVYHFSAYKLLRMAREFLLSSSSLLSCFNGASNCRMPDCGCFFLTVLKPVVMDGL